MTIWFQKEVSLKPYRRGFHLITADVERALPELGKVQCGILNIFIQHSSASLTINENADPTVRADFEAYFSRYVPEHEPYFQHTLEGSDDMPAHLKASILGSNINIPITKGRLNIGVWQGIYLCEHRNNGGARRLVLTIQGQVD